MKRMIIFFVAGTLLMTVPGLAQKGLYIGAGLGTAGFGNHIGDNFDGGGGYQFLLGFKATEKLGFELEYAAYAQKPSSDITVVDKAGYGGLNANVKYFFGRPRQRTFRPYFVGGVGISAFAWELKDTIFSNDEDKQDAIGALTLVPGLGFEVMVGRIAAFNLSGRFALNAWGDETSDGLKKDDDWAGNALILNAGLVLHL